MDSLQLALNKAKISLMSRADAVFFTTVCFSLKHLWDNTLPTAATDGKHLWINPDFFMELSPEQRVFLLLHETMHVAYLHMDRLQSRNKQKWNVAADHVINLMLIARGYKMPSMGLADPAYTGLSTEEVYKLLPDVSYEDFDMDLIESKESPEELQRNIEDILVRASIQSKLAGEDPGSLPGEIQIFLNGLLEPKLPWNRILQKYLQSTAKSDYSFRKPNRRFFPTYHLPSLHSEALMNLTFAVDTSGSVTDQEFKQFISEISTILRMMKPEKITLIQFDTSIKSIEDVTSVAALSKVSFKGRGGTRIGPVIEWANANKPQVLLVFTDGHIEYDYPTTKVDTIWLINNNQGFKSDFGKTIHYEITG